MWWNRGKAAPEPAGEDAHPLREALRHARIEAAERTGVVVDLRDADVARLELLGEALDPLFADIPAEIDLFDRGVSHGDTPRLWIDAVAHVHMGRDKRTYRFVQDSRYGREVVDESTEVQDIVAAVTTYVARRMVEREQAMVGGRLEHGKASPRRRGLLVFLLGVLFGIALVLGAAWWSIHLP
jgi:hypothetical protein